LTLDNLEGSKIKVTVFDVKFVVNGKSYDVGPNGGNVECQLASLWMTLRGERSVNAGDEHDFRSHRQQQPGLFAKNLWPSCYYVYQRECMRLELSSEISGNFLKFILIFSEIPGNLLITYASLLFRSPALQSDAVK